MRLLKYLAATGRVWFCASFVASFCASLGSFATAAVTLPPVLSNGMVLQADAPVPVWGKATPGEKVTVEFAGQSKQASADAGGRWRVDLAPLKASTAGSLFVRADNVIEVKDVLVGEVWFAAGQSNMEAYLYKLGNAQTEMSDPPSTLRLFLIEKEVLLQPADQVNGKWVKAAPKPLGLFSAVGYLFGRELNRRMNVPVGMIQSTWGGTRVDTWMSAEAMQSNPHFAERLAKGKTLDEGYESMAAFNKRMGEWNANQQGKKPLSPCELPSRVYNGMVKPLMPYAVRGVIWYQGESDAYLAKEYSELFPAMILDWRANWGQKTLPFLFVQLPNYNKRVDKQPTRSFWAEQREAQKTALALPDTGMIVTIDVGEEDIHPKNKADVADRLLRLALGQVYGQKVTYKSPSFEKMTVTGSRATIHFKDADQGLRTLDGAAPIGFAIAGEDRKFVWASAKIEGDSIVVWNDEVKTPVIVRYAYQENPATNLVSRDGLPVSPFRTDGW